MTTKKAGPFILRSEVVASPGDATRRSQILSQLSEADLDRVAGGTNKPDYTPDWDPDKGGDTHTVQDPGS